MFSIERVKYNNRSVFASSKLREAPNKPCAIIFSFSDDDKARTLRRVRDNKKYFLSDYTLPQ